MLGMLTINVEIEPGTTIQKAAKAMRMLSDTTQCGVKAKFNGCLVSAWPGRDPEEIVKGYLDRPKGD